MITVIQSCFCVSGDLKQMHKSNVDAYDCGGRVAQIPMASKTETSPHASSNCGH